MLGQPARLATATALSACTVLTIRKPAMAEALHQDHDFANRFIHYLLTRQQRVQDDLVDQLLNSSEKRLARILLLLTHFGKEGRSEEIPKISQTTLAEMTGTTRSRVNQFLKKFKRLGFIDYNGGLVVNSSLLSVVLADQPNDP